MRGLSWRKIEFWCQSVWDGGFDKGKVVSGNSYFIEAPSVGELLSFKVTALNKGGESWPSEILSLGLGHSSECVLVVIAFDRISGPEMVDGSGWQGCD